MSSEDYDRLAWLSHKRQIKELREQRDELLAALEKITQLRYGWDGDCGAVAIAEAAIAKTKGE